MTDLTIEKGNRLKLIIEHSGMSQKAFAEKMGWRGADISSIIGGHKNISGHFLEDFAIVYGTIYSINWLLTGMGFMLMEYPSPSKVSEPPAPYGDDIKERISQLEMDLHLLKKLSLK